MRIRRVELLNIKPFAERAFDFADGVNVLSGPNGSGKSTVFEAIGYALFGVPASDFIGSSDRFVRKGFPSGLVRVHFTAVDGLDYVIERAAGSKSRWALARSTPDGLQPVESKNAAETEATLTRLLGLSDSRTLCSQFTTIIGPPQARFDGAFGVTGKPRMDEFDRILGISAWTDANSKALGIENESKRRISVAEERVASLERSTAKFEEVIAALTSATAVRDALTAELAAAETALAETASLVEKLVNAETRATELRLAAEAAGSAFALATVHNVTARTQLAGSIEAVAICRDNRDDFDAHVAATKALAHLESKRKEREELRNRARELEAEISSVEAAATAAIDNATTELTRLEADIAVDSLSLESAESDLARLAVDRVNAGVLELAAGQWLQSLARIVSPVHSVSSARRAVADVVAAMSVVSELRTEVGARDAVAQRAALYESSRERSNAAVAALAAIDAQLARYRNDVESLGAGLCPILVEPCRNLAESGEDGGSPETLPAPLARRIADAETSREKAIEATRVAEDEASRNSAAQQQLAVIDAAAIRLERAEADLERRRVIAQEAIASAAQCVRESGLRSWLEEAPAGLDFDGVREASERCESVDLGPLAVSSVTPAAPLDLLPDPDGLEDVERELGAAWAAVGKAAADAHGKVSSDQLRLDERHRAMHSAIESTRERLRVASARASGYRQARTEAEARLAGLDSKRRSFGGIALALEAFDGIDERIESEQAKLAASRDGHSRFQQNESLARRHDELEANLSVTTAALAQSESALKEALANSAAAAAESDPAALATAREREKHLAATRSGQQAKLSATVIEVSRLTAERNELALLREEKRAIERELVLLRKTHAAIASMRSSVMSKVPARLGSRYREDVSVRADRIYRRIAGCDEELRWGDEYQIQLVDMAPNAKGELVERLRNDNQLSGGQKMTAVIALRLALLQMTKSSVGFFDEPTSNLDAERRARLAEAFRDLGEGRDGGGRWFGQLFLISHDAAFTEITDHTTWLDAPDATP